MELVLHRANTSERIRAGVAAGFARLEIDLWYKGGDFRLSHDPSLGRFVVGPNGVALSEPHRRMGRRLPGLEFAGSFVTLPEVLAMGRSSLPLLIDLKGWWPDKGLEELANLVAGRVGDQVCSPFLRTIHRFRNLNPEVIALYSDRQLMAGRLGSLRGADGIAFELGTAVSVKAPSLANGNAGSLVRSWRQSGLRICVWQVPDVQTLHALRARGFDGAIIDELAWRTNLPGPSR